MKSETIFLDLSKCSREEGLKLFNLMIASQQGLKRSFNIYTSFTGGSTIYLTLKPLRGDRLQASTRTDT